MNLTKSDVAPVSPCPVTRSSLVEAFDPFDLTNPYPFYERARREEPIFYSPQLNYLEELTRRLPHLRLVAGQAFEYAPNTSFRSPRQVWVEWEVEG